MHMWRKVVWNKSMVYAEIFKITLFKHSLDESSIVSKEVAAPGVSEGGYSIQFSRVWKNK